MTFGIDDGYRLIGQARGWLKIAYVEGALSVALTVIVFTVAVLDGRGGAAFFALIIGLPLLDALAAVRRLRWLTRLDSSTSPRLIVDADHLEISSAAVPSGLTVQWSALEVVCVDDSPPDPYRKIARFPIDRSRVARHPLDEPSWFLHSAAPDLGKEQVRLPFVDLSGVAVPNVVLIFRAPQRVTVAMPSWATNEGWLPPDPLLWARRVVSDQAALIGRHPRTLSARGLYLRLHDPAGLSTAMGARGVRTRLECQDWAFATGQPHD